MDGMGEASSTFGMDAKHTQFWAENLKKRDHLEGLSIDGRTTLKWILNRAEW
jgi:hypothetical protein